MENTTILSADELLRHWLLNLAIEYPVWLGQLFPAIAGEALNAKPVPHCDAQDYARGLVELFDSGMITLSSEVPGDDVESRPGILRILERFLRLSNDDPRLCRDGRLLPTYTRNRLPGMQVSFKVSALGGEGWEGIAEPDWTHIFTISRDDTSGDLISPDRDLLLAYMGWYPEIHQEGIQMETITWQTHSDYEILYWKRLPLVYHASFRLHAAEPRWGSTVPIWYEAPRWFWEWRNSTGYWHKKPWHLPSWPSE